METQNDIDSLIEKQFEGGLSPEQESVLRRWLQEGKDHREYYGRRILLYRWARIQGRIPMFEKKEKRAYRRFLSRVKMPRHPMLQGWKKMAWAAMLVCALGTGGVWLYEASQGQSPLLAQTVEVPEGVKQRMVLADGTKVWLNSGSRLTLDAGFGQTNRGLQLEGEGMFEVAKDGRLPFIIRSGDIRVRVTGTVFNFKAYPEERFAKVTLLQGSLDVYEENGEVSRSVRMAPHEQVVVDREKDVMEKFSRAGDCFDSGREEQEDLSFLQFFAFICMLSFDVYVKKLLIEKLLDAYAQEGAGETGKGKKGTSQKGQEE